MSTYDILLFISVKLIFVNFHRLHAITYIYIYIYIYPCYNQYCSGDHVESDSHFMIQFQKISYSTISAVNCDCSILSITCLYHARVQFVSRTQCLQSLSRAKLQFIIDTQYVYSQGVIRDYVSAFEIRGMFANLTSMKAIMNCKHKR